MAYRDLTGQKINRWTVLRRATPEGVGKSKWWCQCECGTVRIVTQQALVMNKTQSCGCYRADYAREHNRTHGLGKGRLHRIWVGVKDRTCNPKSKYWSRYGGRGITICDEWNRSYKAFYEWAMANGYTDKLTLDRIDNNGNYDPGNCRWATYKEQENNRSNTVWCLYEGEKIPVALLAERTGLSRYMCRKLYEVKTNG